MKIDPTEGKGEAGLLYGSDIPFKVPTYRDPQLFWKYGDWKYGGSYSSALAQVSLCYGTHAKHRVIGSDTMFHGIWHMHRLNVKNIEADHKSEIAKIESDYLALSRPVTTTAVMSTRQRNILRKTQLILGYTVEFFRRWAFCSAVGALVFGALTYLIPGMTGLRDVFGFTLLYSVLTYFAATWVQIRYCSNPDIGFNLEGLQLYTGLAKTKGALVAWWHKHSPGTSRSARKSKA